MTPYLSVVIAARNDNYGGDFLHRLQVFCDVLLGLARRHALRCELLVVEWNPPAERPPLAAALRPPADPGAQALRLVTVSPEVHLRVARGSRMPMFEYLAKNAGLRRARGRFVLVTNPDILLSGELVAELGRERLDEDSFYRADRYDFRGPVAAGQDPEAALRFARGRVFQVHRREEPGAAGCLEIGTLARLRGRLGLGWPGTRLPQSGSSALDDDPGIYGGIHTNAAGDFLLASAAAWQAVRGFPEDTTTYTHLDAYGAHQLRALGLAQRLFVPPAMVLHTDHPRPEPKARPQHEEERWKDELRRIRAGQLGPALNGEDWGLGALPLPELVPQQPAEVAG